MTSVTSEQHINPTLHVPEGLFVTHDFITEDEERTLIKWLDTQPWLTDLSRRTQHYGYKYSYTNRNLEYAEALSGPLLDLHNKFSKMGYPELTQCIVNEYYRNQGINPHTDRDIFGPIIMGVSLGADAVMTFDRGIEHYNCFLPRRSLLMLSGPARDVWKHSLSQNVTYQGPNGNKVTKPQDYRRISCTFRSVISA